MLLLLLHPYTFLLLLPKTINNFHLQSHQRYLFFNPPHFICHHQLFSFLLYSKSDSILSKIEQMKTFVPLFLSFAAEPGTTAKRPLLPESVCPGGQQQQQQQQQQASVQQRPQRPFSRSSSVRTTGAAASRDTSRPPSAIENHLDYFREPVVKSPPEPTRVKSPEGSMRSPDPINWTVPLDTGKTFSVTQSVRDGGKFMVHTCVHSPTSLLIVHTMSVLTYTESCSFAWDSLSVQ